MRLVTNHPQPSNAPDPEPMENSEYASAESERPELLARWQPEPEQQTPPKQLAVRQDGGVTDRFTDDPYLNWLRVGWVIVSSSLTECG